MKKKTLAAAMSLGMAFGAAQVQADSLLFPFYQTGNGVWTFLTLHTDLASVTHYIWNYDDLTTPATECIHEDAFGLMTPLDLVQQTVAHPSLSGLDLPAAFGDASVANYSLVSPAEGFMMISDQIPVESTIRGQAIVFDSNNNLLSAYKGLNNPASTNIGTWNSIFTSKSSFDMTWYPINVVTTSWYVLVTGINMDNIFNWAGQATLFNVFGFVFDRDENPRSGNVLKTITCHEVIDRTDIMTAAQLTHSVNGGYVWEGVAPNLVTGATGALMTKIESAPGIGTTQSLENAFPNLPY
jgi:hypothetical protein